MTLSVAAVGEFVVQGKSPPFGRQELGNPFISLPL